MEGVGEDEGIIGVDGQGSHQYHGQHSSSNSFALGRNFKLVERYLVGLAIYTPRLLSQTSFSLFLSSKQKVKGHMVPRVSPVSFFHNKVNQTKDQNEIR